MIRILIFFLFITITVYSHAQERNFGIAEVFRSGDSIFIKKLVTQVINVSEGTVTKFRTPPDTAKLFLAPDGGVYEGVITWRKVGGTTPVDIIDSTTVDSESGTIYSTTWLHGSTTAAGWYNNTISYATVAGATASYTFIGRQVKIYAERMSSHGTGTVSILKGTQVIVNEAPVSFKSTVKQLPVLVYSSPVLADGTYTVVLKATGGAPTMLDYWRIFKKR